MIRRSSFPPILLDPIRAGEIDGRYVDLTSDLGAVGDSVPAIGNVTVGIIRRDGFPMTASDLALAGSDWPNSINSAGLIVTIGLNAPATAAGIGYLLTLTVNKTLQSRLYIRDLTIDVLASMG